MKLTGHQTEAVYRRYAIVCEADLAEGLKKLAVLEKSLRDKMQPCGTVTDFSHSLATVLDWVLLAATTQVSLYVSILMAQFILFLIECSISSL